MWGIMKINRQITRLGTYLICLISNVYFRLRLGSANEINTYLRLKVHVACGGNFLLRMIIN